MLTTGLLFALLAVAVCTDLRSGKIYNWNTYTGIAIALIIGTINSYGMGSERMQQLLGWNGTSVGLSDTAAGLFACGAVLIVCYVFLNFNGGIGGGDVKLLAMLGAFFGLRQGIEVMLWTFVLAAALAIIMLLWTVNLRVLLGRFIARLRSILLLQTPQYPEGEGPMAPLPKCLPIGALFATILIRFDLLKNVGWI